MEVKIQHLQLCRKIQEMIQVQNIAIFKSSEGKNLPVLDSVEKRSDCGFLAL